MKIKSRLNFFLIVFCISAFLMFVSAGVRAETTIVHANVVWEITDIVVQGNMIFKWKVDESGRWSCNPLLFPDGHTANGIPVSALKDYVLPDQPIGKLIGRFGDCGRIFPMGTSGSIKVLPDEDGEFLYLSMNDDIIGLYGKGFHDNEGALIVNITQSKEQ